MYSTMHRFRVIYVLRFWKAEDKQKETFDRKITVIPTGYLLKNRKDIDRDNGRELHLSAPHF